MTGLLSKGRSCLAVVVVFALPMIPSSAFVFALCRQQEMPAELGLADVIAIYIERHGDLRSNDKDIALVETGLAETQQRGIQRVKEAFYEAVFAQYLIGEAESEGQYFDELLEIAQARVDAGAAPESDAIKVRHERIRAEASLAEAKLQLRGAVIRLAGLLGAKDFRRLPEVTGNLNIVPLNLDLDELNRTALRWRSSVNRPREQILAEVESAYAAWSTHRERAAAMQSTSLSLASDLHAVAHNLYFEKKDGLANLFEAQRSRHEVRQKYFRALLDYHFSLALLESAVGKNLSEPSASLQK
jgi:outer membrane protein TolC